jgi:hypothetical protein
MLASRASEPRKTPGWVNEHAARAHRQRLEHARRLADGEIWLFSGDERALDIKSLVNEFLLRKASDSASEGSL